LSQVLQCLQEVESNDDEDDLFSSSFSLLFMYLCEVILSEESINASKN